MNYDTQDRLANVIIALSIFTLVLIGIALGYYIPRKVETKNVITPDTIITINNGLKDTTYIYKFK